jgi:hypothetical protein
MPLFHFDSQTDGKILEDVEGEELPDVAAAREVAIASAREPLENVNRYGRVRNRGGHRQLPYRRKRRPPDFEQ